jgi:glycosyltransferase involved in cell wall biosynthesis
MTADPGVDVIVPVHNQRPLVEACLASVLETRNETPFELVVVDDASTDPELKARLAQLAEAGRLTLLTNVANLGFTRSVNRGMQLHPNRDVLLLNSDTVVYGDWLDRLRRGIRAAEDRKREPPDQCEPHRQLSLS